MLVIVIILLNSLAKDIICSTTAKDSIRNDNGDDMLKELIQRMDKMQRHMDQMDRNNNKRFDKLEANVQNIKDNIQNIVASDLNMQDNIKNMSMVMETIVEQQMVITAEIFTVSQTLPFCCCHYQNTPGPEQPDTTTAAPLKLLPRNCAEAMGESGSDGVYKVNITNSDIGPFDVYCMKKVAKSDKEKIIHGTWLLIQRRQDNTTDFYQNWNTYQRGFGDLQGNFWIGLDKLYALTKSTDQELWVQLQDRDGITAWAKYYRFAIGDENEKYALKIIEGYEGTAGDSLLDNGKGQMFTTYDNDNDQSIHNCASDKYKGAWWFHRCGYSCLNGIYGNNKNHKGIIWSTFRGTSHSMKYAHMAIRPGS